MSVTFTPSAAPSTAHFVARALAQHAVAVDTIMPFMRRTDTVTLPPGTALEARLQHGLWRVKSGAFRVICDDSQQIVYLALPGDLIGVERLLHAAQTCRALPIVRSVVERVDTSDTAPLTALLREALLQSRRQCSDMLRLRSGQVGERVKLLLSMLRPHDRDAHGDGNEGDTGDVGEHSACANDRSYGLPSLRESADIVGSTPESVCRALSAMRNAPTL